MVDQVAIVGTSNPSLQRANILMRLNRNPVIGDKFSSRHGQKGVLSQQWPDANMPFVASTGMRWARFGHFAVIVWSSDQACISCSEYMDSDFGIQNYVLYSITLLNVQKVRVLA